MSEPKRIQLSREKGWRLPPGAVKVDRTTAFGNPYRIGEPIDMKQARRWGWDISPEGRKVVCEDASQAVRRFAHAVFWDSAIHDHLRKELRGRDLACWCQPGSPCHADTLLMLVNSEPAEIRQMQDLLDARILEVAGAEADRSEGEAK